VVVGAIDEAARGRLQRCGVPIHAADLSLRISSMCDSVLSWRWQLTIFVPATAMR